MTTKTVPTRLLHEPDASKQLPYVHSSHQAQSGILAKWLWQRSAENPENYPRPAFWLLPEEMQ